MTRSTVCAAALPAFPLVLLAGTLVSPTDSTRNADQLAAAATHGPAWTAATLLELLAAALIPVAVTGVVLTIRHRGRVLANVGAALGVLGTIGMASIAFRHVFVYGLATTDTATALHAFDRIDRVFGPVALLLMFCAPIGFVILSAAAARAGSVSRLVPVGAFVFFVSDMLPIPAAEEIQAIVGLVTFTALAWPGATARGSLTTRWRPSPVAPRAR